MAPQLVLLERVENLGDMGNVVTVRPGYARNYLLPQKKALRASKENIAYFEAQKKVLEADNDKRRAAAEKLAKKLGGMKVPLIRQASEGGQLYGSVTARDIAEQVANTSSEKIDRTMVRLNQNYKMIGLFPVDVTLHPEVKVSVTVNIARSVEEAEIQAKTGRALVADDGKAPKKQAVPEVDEEALLASVLEEDALEAKKERDASEGAEESQEAAELAAKAKARAEKKKAKKAEEPEAEEAAGSEEE